MKGVARFGSLLRTKASDESKADSPTASKMMAGLWFRRSSARSQANDSGRALEAPGSARREEDKSPPPIGRSQTADPAMQSAPANCPAIQLPSPSTPRTPAPPTPSSVAKKYHASDLRSAADGFSEANLLGKGSFGRVYRGKLQGRGEAQAREVAIKVMNPDAADSVLEVLNEMLTTKKADHPHLMQIVGYCIDRGDCMLVYELCANGSLHEHLFPKSGKGGLSWKERKRIASEMATAIAHLHAQGVVHRDLKPANVLLGENLTVKVADFGMAKELPPGQSQVSTRIMGTLGYLDPNYMETGKLRELSDIFSLGVILLQILTGLPANGDEMGMLSELVEERLTKAAKANKCSPKQRYMFSSVVLKEILDPALVGNIGESDATEMLTLGCKCCSEDVDERPTAKELAKSLKRIVGSNEDDV